MQIGADLEDATRSLLGVWVMNQKTRESDAQACQTWWRP